MCNRAQRDEVRRGEELLILISGLLIGHGKKSFRGIFRDRFMEKSTNFGDY